MTISFPIFSKDNNTILMTIDFKCGPLCGQGGVFLLKKINDKWTKCYSSVGWLS